MSNQQSKEKNSFWLITWGFFAVQLALIVVLLRRISDRSEATTPKPESVQVDFHLPESITTPQTKLNWDVLGIASVAVTLASTAIFYIAGWIYEVHWYGYYGIDISQIDLTPPRVMVHGIPGILFFATTIVISFTIVAMFKAMGSGSFVGLQDVPFIIGFAYILATISVFILLINLPDLFPTIWAAPLTVPLALLPGIAFTLIAMYVGILALMMRFVPKHTIHPNAVEKRRRTLRTFRKMRLDSLVKAGRFWLYFSFLLLFLLSMAVSTLLGEYDARRGIRSLDGSWQLSKTFLLSDEEISVLSRCHNNRSEEGFEYGPVGLIASNETMLFLTDWKEDKFFKTRPNLYVVSRNEANIHLFIVAPTPTSPPTCGPSSTPRLSTTPLPTATPSS